MGGFSIWHWVIVLLVVLVLFGRGRISEIMGDFGKGIKSFKKGLADDEPAPAKPAETARTIEHQTQAAIDPARDANKAS